MNKSFYIIMGAAMALSLGACSKEDPFGSDPESVTGQFAKSALRVELQNEAGVPDVYNRPIPTRAGTPTADDFTVEFIREDETTAEASYRYAEMPEIVTLPVGSYTARAYYGENASAAWESPYYQGSTTFSVRADEITDDAAPIVAKLSNVRVSIAFDHSLLDNMGDDAKVTVKVGDSGSLDFTRNDMERSGYFAYVEDSHTLAATFSGTVEGYPSSETKAYDDVQPGSHYRITFRLHQAGEEDPGNISGNLSVDASVEIVDMNGNIDPDDDIIEDDMRPVEGDKEDPDDPTPPTPGAGPTVTPSEGVSFDKVNDLAVVKACEIYITSESGIQEFTVEINSNTLTADALADVRLGQHLDLVNPGSMKEGLEGLGFPVEVGGMKDVTFKITDFLPLMPALGPGNHEFLLTVKDAAGTTVKSLKFKND